MNTKKSIALFDIDKTVYNQHSYFAVAKYLIEKGVIAPEIWSEIESESTKYINKTQDYSFTANNLIKIFGKSLEGKRFDDIQLVVRSFFEENKNNFYKYFVDLVPVLKQTHDIYIVTTNSQMFAEAVRDMFGLDGYMCTNFEVVNGVFTGKVLNSLADGKHVVENLLSEYSGNNFAFGDSENDIGMLDRVKNPVCINPTEKLLEVAKEKGWLVVSDADAYEKVTGLLNK
jgi:phosphoserine phosphatase